MLEYATAILCPIACLTGYELHSVEKKKKKKLTVSLEFSKNVVKLQF